MGQGGFSDTTTLDSKAVFTVGALDLSKDITGLNESVITQYSYQMNLNTSFTGDDNLYVRLKTGNAKSTFDNNNNLSNRKNGTYLSSVNSNNNSLKVIATNNI